MKFLCPKLCWLLAGVLFYGLCSTCRTERQVISIIGVAFHLCYFIIENLIYPFIIFRPSAEKNLTIIQSLNHSPFADVALIKILLILILIRFEIVNKHVVQKQQGRLQCTNAVRYSP